METVLEVLVTEIPCVVAVIVIVVTFLRHLAKHNKFLYNAIQETSSSMSRVADTLSRVEARIESVEEKIESVQRDVLESKEKNE
jgi:peptidoglycan hydrolase CwlO-like protein